MLKPQCSSFNVKFSMLISINVIVILHKSNIIRILLSSSTTVAKAYKVQCDELPFNALSFFSFSFQCCPSMFVLYFYFQCCSCPSMLNQWPCMLLLPGLLQPPPAIPVQGCTTNPFCFQEQTSSPEPNIWCSGLCSAWILRSPRGHTGLKHHVVALTVENGSKQTSYKTWFAIRAG